MHAIVLFSNFSQIVTARRQCSISSYHDKAKICADQNRQMAYAASQLSHST